MKKKINKRSPWVCWTDNVRELFKLDPQIKMTYSENRKTLCIYVINNTLKRVAIRDLLPEIKVFDKTKLKIVVKDYKGKRGGELYKPELIKAALTGNPLYCYQHEWNNPKQTNNPFCWVELDKRVIQYPDDNLNALYGDRSCLPADLAREVFGEYTNFIFYDTVNPDRPIPEGDEEDRGPFGKGGKK